MDDDNIGKYICEGEDQANSMIINVNEYHKKLKDQWQSL